jgi:predicted hotdog family 3-hydroxylacyl-ACP dehydratase
MADSIPDIQTLIPQGPPFVMVDRLLASGGPVTRTSYCIAAGNPLVENGWFSVAGLIENMAQTAAAGAGYAAQAAGGEMRSGAIVAISSLEIDRLPAVGEELETTVTVTARVGDIVVISGRITCRQSQIATGEMKIVSGI